MELKLDGCIHHSERIFLFWYLWGHLRSSFVCVYLRYMDVKRNSLCDILKVGEPRKPGGVLELRYCFYKGVGSGSKCAKCCGYENNPQWYWLKLSSGMPYWFDWMEVILPKWTVILSTDLAYLLPEPTTSERQYLSSYPRYSGLTTQS